MSDLQQRILAALEPLPLFDHVPGVLTFRQRAEQMQTVIRELMRERDDACGRLCDLEYALEIAK